MESSISQHQENKFYQIAMAPSLIHMTLEEYTGAQVEEIEIGSSIGFPAVILHLLVRQRIPIAIGEKRYESRVILIDIEIRWSDTSSTSASSQQGENQRQGALGRERMNSLCDRISGHFEIFFEVRSHVHVSIKREISKMREERGEEDEGNLGIRKDGEFEFDKIGERRSRDGVLEVQDVQ